jgi:fumarate reductase subunit D
MSERLTPFLWLLFSAGGTVAAFLFPAHLVLTGLAVPLGWVDAPAYESLRTFIQHPTGRLYFFVFISLPLFHWAHRFRYTLKDALQLHSTAIVGVLCYGTALVGTLIAAYTLWNM